jgi:hypothetical protein
MNFHAADYDIDCPKNCIANMTIDIFSRFISDTDIDSQIDMFCAKLILKRNKILSV